MINRGILKKEGCFHIQKKSFWFIFFISKTQKDFEREFLSVVRLADKQVISCTRSTWTTAHHHHFKFAHWGYLQCTTSKQKRLCFLSFDLLWVIWVVVNEGSGFGLVKPLMAAIQKILFWLLITLTKTIVLLSIFVLFSRTNI